MANGEANNAGDMWMDQQPGTSEDNAAGAAITDAALAGGAVPDAPVTPDSNNGGNDGDNGEDETPGIGDNGVDALKKAFRRDVRQLGGEDALGHDAMPKLFLRVVRAASDGLITVGKKGEKDDAVDIYGSYLESKKKKTMYERSKGSMKAQESKLRAGIKAGLLPNADFVSVLNRAVEIHGELEDAKVKVKSTYPAMVDLAVAQLKSQGALTDEQIRETITKAPADEKTVKDILEGIEKKLSSLITGDKGPSDQSEQVISAHEAIKARLATFATEEATNELIEKATALGYHVENGQLTRNH